LARAVFYDVFPSFLGQLVENFFLQVINIGTGEDVRRKRGTKALILVIYCPAS
jgi:hypothetical protein